MSLSEAVTVKEVQGKVFELTLALYRVTDFFPQGEALRRNLREKANEIFGLIAEYIRQPHAVEGAVFILAKIDSVKGFLEIARSMRFVRPINITVIEREYDFLAEFFSGELSRNESDTKSVHQGNELPISKNEAQENSSVSIQGNKEIEEEELPTWDDFSSDDHKGQSKGQEVQGKEIKDAKEGLKQISSDINERQLKIITHLKTNDQAKISDFHSYFTDISSKTIQRDLQDLVAKNMLKKEGEKRWTIYSLNDVR